MYTSHELLQLQAEWLSEARSRILRLAEIGRRKSVLDLGCGSGAVLQELQQRCSGSAVGLDHNFSSLRNLKNAVNADANHLPFKKEAFDLIFTENVFLWIPQFHNVMQEIHRSLKPGGVFVGIEPDYGGMIEYPPQIESKYLWINGLQRAGADPFIGRKLTAVFQNDHWNLRIELLPRLSPPSPDRFRFLEDLPLTSEEQQALRQITTPLSDIPLQNQIVHLPYFLILAERK